MSKKINITITWKAFGDKPQYNRYMRSASLEFNMSDAYWAENKDYTRLLDLFYEATNLQTGWIWTRVEEILPVDRTHTSLSVGDEIEIDGTKYLCADFGWEKLTI